MSIESKNSAKLIAAFPGTGKTFICEKTNYKSIEIEYWKYKADGLLNEYVVDIKRYFESVDYIFLSSDPEGLRILYEEGFNIILVYPKNELREEYLNRYIERDSPSDFIGVFMKYWNIWIEELKLQIFCKHIVLSEGEYLQNIIDREM